MALQSLNGFDNGSQNGNIGSNDVSATDSKKASQESVIRIFEEQMKSDDSEVRLNFIKKF